MKQLQSIARRVMLQRGLTPDFSAAAEAQASTAAAAPVLPNAQVHDLRSLLWASVDNDDSRDLDQISVAQLLPNGASKILVAIADVDAVVKRGSAVDVHAQTNTTSVYTAAAVFPMLPERLSTDLTSLAEGEDRLAIVMEIVIDDQGKTMTSDVYRAAVQNHAKLAYDSLAAWLDGKAAPPTRLQAVAGLAEQIRSQDRAAQLLRRLRFQKGALNLHTPEAEPIFNGDELLDLKPSQPNRAKELIEDFMVAANGVTARYLAQKGFASMRRVLRAPERWGKLVKLAEGLDEQLPPEPNGEALAQFLARRHEAAPEQFSELSLSVVKLLGRGEYVLELPGQRVQGHFGLAVTDYTHSTAPNRRFPDLLTQRLLKAAIAGEEAPYSQQDLAALASQCTARETNAAKVERQVSKSAAALLLAPRIGEHFDALVTGASEKGTWARITHPATEGRVVHGSTGLEIGNHVRVELVYTDVERGFIDFSCIRP